MTVELFRATLDVGEPLLARLEATLSPAERDRARVRADDRERRRFIADHGWRRQLLAPRLGCAPGEVAYVEGEHGKPRPAGGRLRFSAARSDQLALYAMCAGPGPDAAAGVEVGVDVEWIDRERELAPLAGRLLAPGERAAYEALRPADRPAALYACWVRKEAYAKALGTGLVFPLTALELWTGDGASVRSGEVLVSAADAAEGFAAAVAVYGAASREPVIRAVVDLSTP